MATFLELVNEVERESGTVSQAQRLTTVASPVGRQEKIVQWTVQAWQLIQTARRDWTFTRQQFSHALTIGQSAYTPAELGMTDFGGWLSPAQGRQPYTIYDPALGRGDEARLMVIPYREWLDQYDIGAPDQVRPNVVAEGFNRKLHFGPPPDKAYVARGWYRRDLQTLADDDDEPYIEADFHKAIVWRALMLLAEHDEAPFSIATAQNNFRQVYSRMVREYTDSIEL